MAKRQERLKAIELRKQGWSTPRIAKELGVRLATAILWCQEVALTPEQINEIKSKGQAKTAEAKKQEKRQRIQQHHQKGVGQIQADDPSLLSIGTALYWAEGSKSNKVMIANSDPGIIRIFIKWLKKCFGVEEGRLRYQLHIHEGLDEENIKDYWRSEVKELVDIKDDQWWKTQIKKSSIGHRKHMLYKGTFYVQVNDANLLYQIQGMIQELHEKIMGP